MKRLGVLLGTLVVAALIAGCGGGGSTSTTAPTLSAHAEVEKIANGFSAAFGAGDVKRACGYWSEAEQRDAPGTCVRIYSGGTDATWRQSFLTAKVERAAVTGETATVAYSNDNIAKLRKTAAGWVITELGEAKYYAGFEEEQGEEEFEREWEEIERE